MLHKLYTIRDTKAEFYYTPFAQKTHGEAERSFSGLANDRKTSIGQHPEDYDLYFIGEFDDQTGKALIAETPQHIIKAVHTVKSPNENIAERTSAMQTQQQLQQ